MNNLDRLTIALLFLAIVSVASNVRSTAPPLSPSDQSRRPLPQQVQSAPPSAEPGTRRSPLAPPGPNDPDIVMNIPERTRAIYGTAFSIDSDGTWLTARHVAGACDEIAILSPRGYVSAKQQYLHPQADLAVLKTNGGAPALGRSTQPLFPGQDGFSFGFPLGLPGAVHGTLMGRSRMRLADQMHGVAPVTTWAEQRRIPENIDSLGGISGGPLLDREGEVVGIIVGGSRRRGRITAIAPESIEELVTAQIVAEGHSPSQLTIAAEQIEQTGAALRERFTVTKALCR